MSKMGIEEIKLLADIAITVIAYLIINTCASCGLGKRRRSCRRIVPLIGVLDAHLIDHKSARSPMALMV
jgi:hypothetical protein